MVESSLIFSLKAVVQHTILFGVVTHIVYICDETLREKIMEQELLDFLTFIEEKWNESLCYDKETLIRSYMESLND